MVATREPVVTHRYLHSQAYGYNTVTDDIAVFLDNGKPYISNDGSRCAQLAHTYFRHHRSTNKQRHHGNVFGARAPFKDQMFNALSSRLRQTPAAS